MTRGRWLALGALAASLLVAVWIVRPGVSLDDEIGHFVIARDVWVQPLLLLDVWGRPGTTWLFAPFAPFGFEMARAAAVVMSVGTALLTVDTARRFGLKWPWMAAPLVLLQPWVLNHGHEVITEVPAMLAVALGLWFSSREQWTAATFTVGVLPLIRHELIVFVPLWILYRILERDLTSLASIVPFAVWNLSALVFGVPPALTLYFDPGVDDQFYAAGEWWRYLRSLVAPGGAGPLIPSLALTGLVLTRFKSKALPVVFIVTLIAVESVLLVLGAFATGGYGIFLLPVAGPLAILALAGVNQASAFYAAGFLAVGLVIAYWGVAPLPESPMSIAMRQVEADASTVHAASVFAYVHIPIRLDSDQVRSGELWTLTPEIECGDLVVWDAKYSRRWGPNVEGWVVVDRVGDLVIVYACP